MHSFSNSLLNKNLLFDREYESCHISIDDVDEIVDSDSDSDLDLDSFKEQIKDYYEFKDRR